MAGEALNPEAAKTRHDCRPGQAGQFLPRLESRQVIRETGEKNYQGSRQQLPEKRQRQLDSKAAAQADQQKYAERSCIGQQDRNSADSRDRVHVQLAPVIRLIDEASSQSEIPK